MDFDDMEFMDVIMIEEEWRDLYRDNEFGLDPDDYDSEDEFLDVINDAETQRLEDEEYEDNEW